MCDYLLHAPLFPSCCRYCPCRQTCTFLRFGSTGRIDQQNVRTAHDAVPTVSSTTAPESDLAMAYESANRGHYRRVFPAPAASRALYKRIDSLCARFCTKARGVARSQRNKPRPRIEILPDSANANDQRSTKPRRLIKVVSKGVRDAPSATSLKPDDDEPALTTDAETSADQEGQSSGGEMEVRDPALNEGTIDAHTVSASKKSSKVCLIQ